MKAIKITKYGCVGCHKPGRKLNKCDKCVRMLCSQCFGYGDLCRSCSR